MSSNARPNQRTYNSIYLKKKSYNTHTSGMVIKKYKVKKGQHKGKVAHVLITIDKNGKEICKISYKNDL
jgi:hypothetical protein